jgi:hypothetical protein
MTCVSRGIAVLTVQDSGATAVAAQPTPTTFDLQPNFPNPFNPSTTIAFSLPQDEHVRVSIHALDGTRVAVLADRMFAAGEHRLQWHGQDATSRELPSGTYIARLESASQARTRKLTLLR